MAVVGYLFGAGASAQCIPVVNGMAEDIKKLIVELSRYTIGNFLTFPGDNDDADQLNKAINVLSPLVDICENYYSIDTYAKKLFLTDERAFKKLKLDLCLYFTLRQIVTKPDKRYDNFFSSIINTKDALPSKIKVISWNYDFQIEKSFSEFIDHDDFDELRSHLGMVSPADCKDYTKYYRRFNVIKLNGSARIETKDHKGYLFSSLSDETELLTREVTAKYFEIIARVNYTCDLKFAWEGVNNVHILEVARPELANITVLVIVGYSFPFFNREIDSEILKAMPSLRKIYIQDVNPRGIEETMRDFYDFQLPIKGVVEVIHKTNLNQFVFPKELDITD